MNNTLTMDDLFFRSMERSLDKEGFDDAFRKDKKIAKGMLFKLSGYKRIVEKKICEMYSELSIGNLHVSDQLKKYKKMAIDILFMRDYVDKTSKFFELRDTLDKCVTRVLNNRVVHPAAPQSALLVCASRSALRLTPLDLRLTPHDLQVSPAAPQSALRLTPHDLQVHFDFTSSESQDEALEQKDKIIKSKQLHIDELIATCNQLVRTPDAFNLGDIHNLILEFNIYIIIRELMYEHVEREAPELQEEISQLHEYTKELYDNRVAINSILHNKLYHIFEEYSRLTHKVALKKLVPDSNSISEAETCIAQIISDLHLVMKRPKQEVQNYLELYMKFDHKYNTTASNNQEYQIAILSMVLSIIRQY